MFSPLPNRRSWLGSTALSVAAHAVVAVALFFSLRMHPVKVFSLPGTDLGTRVELTYLPGRAPAPAPHPQTRVKPKALSGPLSPHPSWRRHRPPSIFRPCHILRSLRPPLPQCFLPRIGYSGLE